MLPEGRGDCLPETHRGAQQGERRAPQHASSGAKGLRQSRKMPWAFSAQALAKAHEDLELEKAGLLAVMRRVHTQERELGWFRSTQGRAV